MKFEPQIRDSTEPLQSREQEIGERLRHPYILRVEPADPEQSRPYLVMEYLQGQTLGNLMRSMRTKLPVTDAAGIAARICEALEQRTCTITKVVSPRSQAEYNIMICNDGSIRGIIMDFARIAKVEAARGD